MLNTNTNYTHTHIHTHPHTHSHTHTHTQQYSTYLHLLGPQRGVVGPVAGPLHAAPGVAVI